MLSKSTPEASEGLSEAAGAPKKQTKARNRKLIGPKNAPRAPGNKKERSQGGGEYARAGLLGAGPEPRGGVGEGFCNKDTLRVLTPRNPAKLGFSADL